MIRYFFVVITLLLINNTVSGQSLTVNCIEKEIKNPDGGDPIIIRTCFIKNYKFKKTSSPDDYTGAYSSETEVYVLVNHKYIETVNSAVFNKRQDELLSIINERVQNNFKKYSLDPLNKECFTSLSSIPKYKMNDFEITFQNIEIWFEIEWDSGRMCRAVGGTIITFKLPEIQKYLK